MKDKVVIVDKEKQLQSLYQNWLERVGYDVVTVSSGDEALAIMPHDAPEVVVIDIECPEGKGVDCLERFLNQDREVKIVINTTRSDYKLDFHTWAADAFLMKSDDPNELVDTIDMLLHDN